MEKVGQLVNYLMTSCEDYQDVTASQKEEVLEVKQNQTQALNQLGNQSIPRCPQQINYRCAFLSTKLVT